MFTLPIHKIRTDDEKLVGQKAMSLGELSAYQIPVPDGFVVTSKAFETFLDFDFLKEKIINIFESLDRDNPVNVSQISFAVKQLITTSYLPKDLIQEIYQEYDQMGSRIKGVSCAVRTSETEDKLTSGQNPLFLNVKGDNALVSSIKEVWAGHFSPYNLRVKKHIFKDLPAVIIQRMIFADSAGFLHTTKRDSKNKNFLEIESVWGNGELLVEGKVKPDTFLIDKKSGKVISQKINKQDIILTRDRDEFIEKKLKEPKNSLSSLSHKNLKLLTEIGNKVENIHYYPQTVEWLCYHDQIYVVQMEKILEKDKNDLLLPEIKEKLEIAQKEEIFDLKIISKGFGISSGIVSGKAQIVEKPEDKNLIDPGEIIVLENFSEEFFPLLKYAKALISQKGTINSSGAILAKELKIPAIFGAGDIFEKVKTGKVITVNGSSGTIFAGSLNLNSDDLVFERNYQEYFESKNNAPVRLNPDKIASEIYLNLPSASFFKQSENCLVNGVCQVRAEYIYEEMGIHPKKLLEDKKGNEIIHLVSKRLENLCKSFGGRKVIFCFSDIRSNTKLAKAEFFEEKEENPEMGLRGVFRHLVSPALLKTEIEAVLKIREKYKNLKLAVPFLRTPEELFVFKKFLANFKLEIKGSLELWLNFCTPANLILAPAFLKQKPDGIVINLDLLTSFCLAVDKQNIEISSLFNQEDESVLWLISHTANFLKKQNLPFLVSFSNSATQPYLVYQLLKAGVTGFCVSGQDVKVMRKFISFAERKLFK